MSEHQKILRKAVLGELPDTIDDDSGIDIDVFTELYDAGLIKAIDASSGDGPCYMEPRITLAGRERLSDSEREDMPWWRSFDRRIAVWSVIVGMAGIVAAIILARAT